MSNKPTYEELEQRIKALEKSESERKQTETEVKATKDFYENIIEGVQDGIWVTDKNDVIFYANESMGKIAGIPAHEIIGNNVLKDFPEETTREFNQFYKKAKKALIPVWYEIKVKTPAGRDTFQNGWLIPRIKDEEFDGIICTIRDVTKGKLAEKLILESEEKHRTIIETAISGFWITSKYGELLDVNDAYCQMSGYSNDELLTMKISDVETIDSPSDIKNRIINITKNGSDRFETKHRRKDGSVYDVEINIQYQPFDGGQFVCFINDITERKLAEEELKKSENRFRSMFENHSIAMLLIEPDSGKILDSNKSANNFYGYTHQELTSMNIEDINILKSEKVKKNRKLAEETKVNIFVFKHRLKNNTLRDVQVHSTPIEYMNQTLLFSIIYDITERKQVEMELRESRAILQAAMDQSPAGIAIADAPDGALRFVNDAGLLIRGGDRQSIVDGIGINQYVANWHLLDLDGRTLKTDEVPLARAIMFGETNSREFIVRRDKSDDRVVLGNAAPIKDDSDKVIAAIVVFTDITESKQAEQALNQSEAKFRGIFEQSPIAIEIFDVDGKLMDVNQHTLDMFGIDNKKYVIGFNLWEDPNLSSEKTKSLKDGKPIFISTEFDFEIVKTNNLYPTNRSGTMYMDMYASPLIEENEVTGYLIQIIEVTDRKQSEETLKKSEAKFRNLIKTASDAIYLISDDGTVLETNNSACSMLNRTETEIKQLKVSEIDPNFPGNEFNLFWEKIPLNVPHIIETIHLNSDGTRIPVEVSGQKFLMENKIFYIAIARDITERKRLEKQLQQSQKMESIGTLAGGIAHDFNNMLGIITGNISFILSNINKDDELYEVLTDIQESSKQAQGLTHQLLTFSKGGAPIKKVTDINKIVREAAVFSIRGANSKCIFELSDALLPSEVDEGQINQVVNNLVINANQAMPNGGTIIIRTENANIKTGSGILLPAGRYVRITVEDQGIGISKNNLLNVFEPYFTTKQKGSGLGLATSYSIIKKHDGHISVYSEIEKGTVFTIYLPASINDLNEHEEQLRAEHKGQGKILIMDDQEIILKMVERMLNNIGYNTVCAADGAQAIEMYQEAQTSKDSFDAVILDLTVPGGMGGLETIIELLKIDPNVKAIVSSGYSHDPIMSNCKDYGFCGTVPKPYTMGQLSEVLSKIFGGNM